MSSYKYSFVPAKFQPDTNNESQKTPPMNGHDTPPIKLSSVTLKPTERLTFSSLTQKWGGGVAEWLILQTPDLEVRGSSLARRVVSLDKELYSTLSLFTQVYKLVTATYCWGGGGGITLRWTSIPSRVSRDTPRCFMLMKPR